MSSSFQHVSAELRLFNGESSLDALRREIERSGARRAVIVCGRTIGASLEMDLLRAALGPLLVAVSSTAREHSPLSAVEETTRCLADHEADALIAVGGGSAAVTARAAVILHGEKRPLQDLATRRTKDGKFESPRLQAVKLPIFVVPTTPSTAFVKAGTAVHADDGQRLAMFDPRTRARGIFIHPRLVLTAPDALVVSATLNALSNAVEALESPACDPVSEAMLMQALRLIQQTVATGRPVLDLAARERLVMAAVLCGRGTEQGGTGLASVLAHAIGQRAHVANGRVGAIVLPHTMAYNAPATSPRSPAVLHALSAEAVKLQGAAAIDAVRSLLAHLDAPATLRQIGVVREDLWPIAQAAMSDWFVSRNARPVRDAESLLELLEAAW